MVPLGHGSMDCTGLDSPSRALGRIRTVLEKPKPFPVPGSTCQPQLFPCRYFTAIHTKSSLQRDMVS